MTDAATPEPKPSLPQYSTPLTSVEHQVGADVIAALQHPETVGVLSIVAKGPGGVQHVVSVGLEPKILEQVQHLFLESLEERTKRVPCVGFHCYVDDRDGDGIPDEPDGSGTEDGAPQ